MEDFDSPRVSRSVVPSPLRLTPSPSKEVLQSMYSSPLPRFMVEAIDNAPISDEVLELPKHYLPDFKFRLVHGRPNPTTEQFAHVASCFPGCTSVAYTPPFLVVSWAELPMKPWPLTCGGLPLYYGTPERHRPPSFGRPGGSKAMLTGAEDRLEPWVHPKGKTKDIIEFLIADGIEIRYFGWSGFRWYAEVSSATDGAKLPSAICSLLVLWKVWKKEDSESARRAIVPDGGTITDRTSYYPALRPGVMVESAAGRGSTSGIPLLGADGSQYITVAEYGFPNGDRYVFHPVCGPGNLIARVENNILDSHIALAKVVEGITYSSTSFDGDELNGTLLDGLIHSSELNVAMTLFLDSPYNGKCQGFLISIGYHVLPLGSSTGNFQYLECYMVYFGNGANDIFPGTCGSAMWTEDNKVAAFFRWYFLEDAVAFAHAVDALIGAGYDINPIL